MVKVIGKIAPLEVKELEAEGETYADAKAALEGQVPEGWRLIQTLTIA
ncbi:hypothetical protein LVY72_01010 [Arthrobacter sp. I2-34]|uniref:DUF4177 domain-containing protein n=1 Tax=Arthrobacter hankyongi TaxID=2904801 RepID=A0ABS9L1B1_9MICC|nr:hypothetical protein [Arthrobacter hankyongi]MCG2620487.1 hypothetical protein [Arthrobacter hankyongi]